LEDCICQLGWKQTSETSVMTKTCYFISYSPSFKLFYWSWNRRILHTKYDSTILHL